jgi:ferritin-like metal-binding protein YciE
MALNSPGELFMYELSAMRDAEKKSGQLFAEAAGKVKDGNLSQMLRMEEQSCQQKLKNLDSCFQAMGSKPQNVTCATVDGMRTEFQAFMSQQPSQQVMELYTLGAAMKLSHFGTASYRGLVDKAVVMGDNQCAQILQTNLVEKEERAGMHERMSHQMNQQVMATA